MNRIDRVIRIVVASCLVTLVCAQQPARSQKLTSAEAAWAAMTKCAAIAAADSRHACADDVMRSAGLLLVTQDKPAAQAEPVPAKPIAPLSQKDDNQLEITLAAVAQGGDGKLVLTSTEGAIWRQVERIDIFPPPQQGQTVTISKTSFGGFMCKLSKWVAFRCYRAR
ncbi:MAG TPA: hypothetical protein VNY82_15175 [Steroidobacteraceae bacterium]|nr:hypothetical protein [Steroidobacteraceae bacterium]